MSAFVLDLYNLTGQYVLEVHFPPDQLSDDGSPDARGNVAPKDSRRSRVSQSLLLTFSDAFWGTVAMTGAPRLISISQSRTMSAYRASRRDDNQVGRLALLSELRGNTLAV